MALKTVCVPQAFEPLFEQAESAIATLFEGLRREPERGMIEIAGQRYVLVRAASLSVEFFEVVRKLFGRGRKKEADGFARNLLFDLAHAVGRSDARCFHEKMGLTDPVQRLSAGPVLFAHMGWASVDIFPESNPSPDHDFFLVYEHPYTFEANAWLESRSLSAFPVCIMNAGYSSGWCEQSFGVPLVATEVLCRVRGDVCCRFVMAPPERIEQRVEHYIQAIQGEHHSQKPYVIPGLFERKRIEESLRQSEERFRKVVAAAQDAIIMLDGQGRICLWNESAERIFGYTAAEATGQDLHKLLTPSRFHDAYEKGISHFHRTGQGDALGRVLELAAVRKGGQEFPIELSLSAMQLSGEWHAVGVVRDISQRKQSEAFERERDGLRQAVKGMERVLGVIGHELRTPLAGVQAMAEFLLRNDARETAEHVRFLKGIRDEVVQMGQMVNDLLETARVNSGAARWHWSAFSLAGVCEGAVGTVRPLIDAQRVSVSCAVHPPELMMQGDEAAVRRLIVNLLSNAQRHTQAGEIGLRVTGSSEPDGCWVEIEVRDTGSGISPEGVEKLGEAFALNRGVVGDHCTPGSGLGLSICRGIAGAHGGVLEVRSRAGEGTTVRARMRADLSGPAMVEEPPAIIAEVEA